MHEKFNIEIFKEFWTNTFYMWYNILCQLCPLKIRRVTIFTNFANHFNHQKLLQN